jgi:hypothetical protein
MIDKNINYKDLAEYFRLSAKKQEVDNEYLKEIDSEIQEKENLIYTLTSQLNDLKSTRKKLIETNCEHVYKSDGYCMMDKEPKTQMRCIKCGKIAYYEGIFIHEVKEGDV